MSTSKTESPKRKGRQIVGFSMSPVMAEEVKAEAARRGLSLRALFEEMWGNYEKKKSSKAGL